MKLIIQIPCYNEEETLKTTLDAIPKVIKGADEVEILIINDGSTDSTVQVAKDWGVHHVIGFSKNLGLARAFDAGLKECVSLGADIIVNLDADNQYNANDIEKLIAPILEGHADIVIGARPIESIKHFSCVKKFLQKLGSHVMRIVSGTNVQDAPSGFRAFSRHAAIRMNVFDNYTYTMETIIQAQKKGLTVANVPVSVNEDLRPSRIVKNYLDYILRSIKTMLRICIIYRPFRFFIIISLIFLLIGLILGFRFLYYYLIGEGKGHIQSLILCGLTITIGFQTGLLALLADLLAINRRLLEDIQIKLREK